MVVQKFPSLENFSGLHHGFTLREPLHPDNTPAEVILSKLGLPPNKLVQAEQIHGAQVARITPEDAGTTVREVDALISSDPEVILVIRTADCAPVFIYDPRQPAIGLIHSGKKGTEANIVRSTVTAMRNHFDCRPENLVAVIGPCIRPPDYEIDFAATIKEQLNSCGVTEVADCGDNTASDLVRFYSYRKEKGKTGRHYAFLSLTA